MRDCRWKGLLVLLLLMLIAPKEVMALQAHSEPEGMYVHQMAHLHYIFALGYFFWDIRRSSLDGRGWRFMQVFCLLMIGWNVLAFVGHFAALYLDPTALLEADQYLGTRLYPPFTAHKMLYFIAKLDHLIYVPALLFLFLGVRSFYHATVRSAGERAEQ